MPVTTRKTNVNRHPGEIVAPKTRRTSAQKAADDAAKAKAKADLEKKRHEQQKKIAQMEKQMADVQERLRIAREHAEDDDMDLDAQASYEDGGRTNTHTSINDDGRRISARIAEHEPEDASDVEMASVNFNSDADADADAGADADADADDDAGANSTSEAPNAHAGGLSIDADADSAVASNQGEEQLVSAKRDGTSQTRPAFLMMSDGSKRRVQLVSMEIPSQHEASSPSPNARKRPLSRSQNNSAFSESDLSDIETPIISKHLQKKKKLTSQSSVQVEAEAMSSGQSVASSRQVSRGSARHSAIALTSRSRSRSSLLILLLYQPSTNFLLCASQASYLCGPCNSIRRPCDAAAKQSPANKTLSYGQVL